MAASRRIRTAELLLHFIDFLVSKISYITQLGLLMYGEYDKINERIQRITKSLVHVSTNNFPDLHPHEYVFDKHERLIKKVHKIRAGIEPTSSDNRSAILPLNYLIFTPVIKITAYSRS